MKHIRLAFAFFALFMVLLFPLTILAAELPADYNKNSNLVKTIVCDQGKSALKVYSDKESWGVYEITPASGDLLIYLKSVTVQAFFWKRVGSTQVTETTFKEFDPVFKNLAPEVHNAFTGKPDDCVAK